MGFSVLLQWGASTIRIGVCGTLRGALVVRHLADPYIWGSTCAGGEWGASPRLADVLSDPGSAKTKSGRKVTGFDGADAPRLWAGPVGAQIAGDPGRPGPVVEASAPRAWLRRPRSPARCLCRKGWTVPRLRLQVPARTQCLVGARCKHGRGRGRGLRGQRRRWLGPPGAEGTRESCAHTAWVRRCPSLVGSRERVRVVVLVAGQTKMVVPGAGMSLLSRFGRIRLRRAGAQLWQSKQLRTQNSLRRRPRSRRMR